MKSTAKAIGVVTIIMLFSRLLSLFSSSLYMARFQGIRLEIYTYAIQIPNIIFTSFGTALATVIIPVFAGYVSTGKKKRAFKFANNMISLSMVFTIALSALCVLAAPLILYFTPRFKSEDYNFAVYALRVMFPIMIFYAMNYIFQGILQSFGRFNMPAFVSIPSSLIVILYVLFMGQYYGFWGLVVATFVGLTTQALILIPPIFKTEYRFRPSFNLRDEDIIKAMKLIPPILVGTSAYQVNMLFNNSFASSFEDTVQIMYYVQSLILYAVLAFVYSVTAVVFPKFTALAANNDMQGFKTSLAKVLRSILYLLIPCTVGFIAVRYQLVGLLLKWGKVSENNTDMAAGMIALYAVGICGIGIKEVVDRAFYSLKDTVRPTINGVIMMAVNITASVILARFIRQYGIPMAYSISSLLGMFVLLYLIRRKIGSMGFKKLVLYAAKVIAASGIMFLAVTVINMSLEGYTFGFSFLDRCVKLFIPVGAGAIVYFILTYLLRIDESVDALDKVKSFFVRTKT